MIAEKVAIQGMKGSFHHEAADLYFNNSIDLIECETFTDVVDSVTKNKAGLGIMAIENSLAGCIIPNYNLLRKHDVEVVGEVGLRVRLNIMALPGTKASEIDEVHSHQMAIRQCGNFFHSYPTIKVVETFDTAGSAKNIRDLELSKVAAIASAKAAKEYDLEISNPVVRIII